MRSLALVACVWVCLCLCGARKQRCWVLFGAKAWAGCPVELKKEFLKIIIFTLLQ
ncbi:uncharacterized protein MEPE_06036 [Melanopsichium pennsylvanicum]|uniref:Uncharacterized protein n=1 Tax=Melanopsichium pennsylvanicum TaxID=63383 RepID=A0AAJ4XST7_9BASI|nr:uncharacterized protein MEPE_06036 [Melanopsichium pennsylvanicum]